MNQIYFILNENKVVFHDEDKPCSGTLSSTLMLINGFKGRYSITVYHQGEARSVDGVEYVNVKNLSLLSKVDAIAIFVGSAGSFLEANSVKFRKSYYWLHNFERTNNKKNLIIKKELTGIICVSKYQMFTMLKSGVFFKSTYIHNPFEFKKEINIAFAGALKKEKSIDNVIRLWRNLRNNGVLVNLHIFGSGDIYGLKDYIPGKSGVIDARFEVEFIDLMLDQDGNLDSSLIFYGMQDKITMSEVISKCDYFISGLNENGAAECFSMAFLEAQAMNTPILTLIRGGQPESLYHSGSKAFVSILTLERYLIKTIEKRNELSLEKIIGEWESYIGNNNKALQYKKQLLAMFSGCYVVCAKLISRFL
ncbi:MULTISPECIES: glycosyltransferase [unclassified Aeromonas]|uniref:glycosyltransferase n=1 Tax=unclassified Aeromonas TaxID=257493 RepID=UPI0022E41567|nr:MULTISPECIES: glycosyltransferase [unclassified Aeromonas]